MTLTARYRQQYNRLTMHVTECALRDNLYIASVDDEPHLLYAHALVLTGFI